MTYSKLALGSLLIALFSFVNLFGIEKAALAVILGMMALKENRNSKMAKAAIIIGITYLILIVLILLRYVPELHMLLGKLLK